MELPLHHAEAKRGRDDGLLRRNRHARRHHATVDLLCRGRRHAPRGQEVQRSMAICHGRRSHRSRRPPWRWHGRPVHGWLAAARHQRHRQGGPAALPAGLRAALGLRARVDRPLGAAVRPGTFRRLRRLHRGDLTRGARLAHQADHQRVRPRIPGAAGRRCACRGGPSVRTARAIGFSRSQWATPLQLERLVVAVAARYRRHKSLHAECCLPRRPRHPAVSSAPDGRRNGRLRCGESGSRQSCSERRRRPFGRRDAIHPAGDRRWRLQARPALVPAGGAHGPSARLLPRRLRPPRRVALQPLLDRSQRARDQQPPVLPQLLARHGTPARAPDCRPPRPPLLYHHAAGMRQGSNR